MTRNALIVLFLFTTAIVAFFYLQPTWDEFQILRKNNAGLQNLSAELDELIGNRDLLFEKINAISKDNLTRIDTALPSGPRAAEFLVFLENLATKHSVTMTNTSLTGSTVTKTTASSGQPRPSQITTNVQGQTIAELPLSLQVTGSYEALKNFLGDLEKNLRITDVENISFSSPSGKNKNEFQFSLTLKAYHQ